MTEEELPLCECGCGLPVAKMGNRFINGHQQRGKKPSPKTRSKISETSKQYYIDNPEAREAARLKTIEQYSTQGAKNDQSKRLTEYWSDQANRDAMSEIKKNSESAKASQNRQRGGNDIVEHHYIYDHSDLSKYTTKMTRSQHQSLHRNMQTLGLKVPHINTGRENTEELKIMKYIKKIELEPKGL